MKSQALIAPQSADQVGFGPGLYHLEFFIADILVFQAINLLMNGFAHLLRSVPRQRYTYKAEQARILGSGQPGKTSGEGSDLLVAHHGAVETGSAARGDQIGNHIVDGIVRIFIAGPVVSLDIDRLRLVVHGDHAFRDLLRFRRNQRFWFGGRRDCPKIFFHNRKDLLGLKRAHQDYDCIGGNIISAIKLRRFGGRKVVNLRRPANGRPMIRMSGISRGCKLLDKFPDGVAVGAQSALFMHHVAFFIEFAQHRASEPRRLQVGPHFETVDRHGVKILCAVHAGAGVHADTAFAVNDFPKTVLDDVLVRIFHGLVKRRLTGSGNFRPQVQMAGRHCKSRGSLLHRDRGRRVDAVRRQPGFAQLGR